MPTELSPETYYRVEERYAASMMAAMRVGRAEARDLAPDPDDWEEMMEGVLAVQNDSYIPDEEKEEAVIHLLAARASQWRDDQDFDGWLYGSH